MVTKAIDNLFIGPASPEEQSAFGETLYEGLGRWKFNGVYRGRFEQQLTYPGAMPVTPKPNSSGIGGIDLGYEGEMRERDFGNFNF